MKNMERLLPLLDDIVAEVTRAGIDACDLVYQANRSLEVDYSDGAPENTESSEVERIALRVIHRQKQGITSCSLPFGLPVRRIVDDLLARVEALPVDATCGLSNPEQLYTAETYYDYGDKVEWNRTTMTEQAAAMWNQVMATEGISHSSGAQVAMNRSISGLVTSHGFRSFFARSGYQMGVSAIVGTGTEMEEDHWYESRLFAEDIRTPIQIADEAANRALRRRDQRSVRTDTAAVFFEPRLAGRLVRQICGAINGAQIVRGTSFLTDQKENLFHPDFTVIDDPFRYRAMSGCPFDAEGLAKRTVVQIESGLVKKYILDLASSRGLGLTSTAQACRGALEQPPSPGISHLIVESGQQSLKDILAEVGGDGLWVTEMIGQGLDRVTGQFSCGASGLVIESREIVGAFRNITLAGDGRELLRHLRPVGASQHFGHADVPCLYLGTLTVGR